MTPPTMASASRQSSGAAPVRRRGSLQTLWTSANEHYPPNVYGRDVLITVHIRSISILNDSTAQVRLTKTREEPGARPVERDFIATVGFAFHPAGRAPPGSGLAEPAGF